MIHLQHSLAKPHGVLESCDRDGNSSCTDTLQCVHCGRHWEFRRGSGKKRGFCSRCGGPHCGAPSCWECKDLEAQ